MDVAHIRWINIFIFDERYCWHRNQLDTFILGVFRDMMAWERIGWCFEPDNYVLQVLEWM